MDNKAKESLMESVIHDDFTNFRKTLNKIDLVLDESYFDYELLKAALFEKRESIANFLIDKGCRVRNPNKILDETPLHLAMKLEDLSVVSVILNNDASIYDKDIKGDTPLHAAFKERYYSAVSAVLDYITNYDLTFHPDNKDDVVHFHIACIRKHIASVKRFLSLGFDVNSYLSVNSAEFSGMTPLHYVISKSDYGDLFNILLESSDLTIKNSNGLTPLHSIYYHLTGKYNEGNIHFYFCQIMGQVFKHGNDTKFINAVEDNSGLSHFHLCCSADCLEWVQVFIDSGVDVNSSISFNCSCNPGFTALHFALHFYACTENVELLLKNGADCNRTDKNGVTPLHLAIQILECDYDAFNIIDILLIYSACPIAVDRSGNTPIHLLFHRIMHDFSQVNKKIMNKLILKIPVKVNLTDKTGLSYFHILCTSNYLDRVNDYLNSGVAIDSVSHSSKFPGYTALHFAVAFNQKDVVELLLKRNAQVNISSAPYFHTPLHLACEFTHLKLYDIDYEYMKRWERNDTPENLDWIPNRTKQLDIIRLLLLYGADIEAKNGLKYTPLYSAFAYESDFTDYWSKTSENSVINEINARLLEITKILLSNKASIDGCETDKQESIFHVISNNAFSKISDGLMECLLTAGADINAVDKDGLTPLHHAVRCSMKESVQSFLKHKANVNIKSKKDKTPLELAIEVLKEVEDFNDEFCEASQSCIRILLENGSDVNTKTSDGRSFLHEAVSFSSTFLIENLLYYGADINVEDLSGNSPVCSLLIGEINKMSISCIIFIHVQKLLALGLSVNDKVQKFCYSLLQYAKNLESKSYYNSIRDGFDNCVNELNRMKLKNIDYYTSLYDILLKDSHELSKHMRNKKFIEILEEQDIDKKFPLYSYLLKLQYKKGLLRSEVLKDAKRSLIYITSSNLPELCYDSILRYLNNEEIINLKAAAAGKTKRKLSENCSNETEPSIKLLKS